MRETALMWLTYYQGEVYAKVIVEVCKQSRPDFEDGGVDESVLDLLRSVRCSLHNFFICAIATFHDDHIINQRKRKSTTKRALRHST